MNKNYALNSNVTKVSSIKEMLYLILIKFKNGMKKKIQ